MQHVIFRLLSYEMTVIRFPNDIQMTDIVQVMNEKKGSTIPGSDSNEQGGAASKHVLSSSAKRRTYVLAVPKGPIVLLCFS